MTDLPAPVGTDGDNAVAGLGARAVRNTAMILVARVISRLIALVTVVAIGNALGDTQFGQMQTAVTYGALISVFADLGFGTLFVREGARHTESINRFLNNVMSIRLLLMMGCIPLLAGALWIAGLTSLLIPSFTLLLLAGYSNLLRSTLYAVQKLGYESIAIVAESLILLALVLVGVATHAGIAFFLWAYAISYACTAIYFSIVLIAKGISRPRWQLEFRAVLRPWLRAGLPLAITYIFTTVYFKIDVPILQRFRPYDEVGWYAFAYKPFEALLFVPMTLRTVIFPVLSVYYRSAPHRVAIASEKFFKALLLLGWPCTVGLFLLSEQFNGFLHLYPQSAPALQILSLAIVFMFVDNTFAATLNAVDRQKVFAYIALAGLAINVALNMVLIPHAGYLGASWSVVITEIALVIIGWWTLRRYVGTLRVWLLAPRIVVAGIVMGVFVILVRSHLPVALTTMCAAAIYGVALLLLRVADGDERQILRRAIGR